MHAFLGAMMGGLLALTDWVARLASLLAALAGRPPAHGDFLLANIVGSSLIVAVLCLLWAVISRKRALSQRHRSDVALSRAEDEIRLREALVSAGGEAVVVMDGSGETPLSYRGGDALLQACLGGPQGAALAAKLNALTTGGAGFRLAVTTAGHRSVWVRGRPVGGRAAIFLQGDDPAKSAGADLGATLDSLPVPVWVRGPDLALNWSNQAYLEIAGAGTLEDAQTMPGTLFSGECELSRAAFEGARPVEAKRYTSVGDTRRAFALTVARQPDASVVGVAIDVTEATHAEAELRLAADAHAQMLDRLDVGVAVFGADRRLKSANRAAREQWGVKKEWLAARPAHGDLLDHLRQSRRLPERRDFAEWKKEQQGLFAREGETFAETWHLADGTSIDVCAHADRQGGVCYFFTDVTAQLRAEAAHNALLQMDRAILDTLEDGMAVFGPDGRLQLYNRALVDLWNLSPSDLDGGPHLTALADLCGDRPGYDVVWKIVSAAVNASEPSRFKDWMDVLPTADGRMLSLSVSRLPSGATLVRFEDMTDQHRFEAELAEPRSSAESEAA